MLRKNTAVWAFCVLLLIALSAAAFYTYFPISWQTYVDRAQTEAALLNDGTEFTLTYSGSSGRYAYALFESTDGSGLYVDAVTERAPLAGLYSREISVMDANRGGYDGLGELVLNGQLSLADETVSFIGSNGRLQVFLCLLLLAVSIANLIIVITKNRAEARASAKV